MNLNDGDTFTVDTRTLEMDSGITLDVTTPGVAIADGTTFSVSNGATTVLYRFDKTPGTPAPPGSVEVAINDTMSAAQVAAAIAANFLAPISQVAPNPPLPNPLAGQLRAVHLASIGQPTRVYIEDLTPATPNHSASSGTPSVLVVGQAGVSGGNLRVYFTPLDTANQIAARIESAVAADPIPNVQATAQGNTVRFVIPPGSPPLVVTIPPTTPFTAQNLAGGAGGSVTGIQFLGTDMFAVTDTGSLLRYSTGIFGGISQSLTATFATNLNQIPFTGLSLGPQNVDVDRDGTPDYARIFFATAADGQVYAFDEFGVFAPIFADGATSVSMGGPGAAAQGIAFSTLDYNLWHVTNRRNTDAGHGINPAFDGSRGLATVQGGTSFYFGLEDPRVNTTISNQPGAGNYITQPQDLRPQNVFNTYNLPGGAQGSLTTNPFSLAGYAPTDKPTLYFNYFLESQNANANTQQNMRDSVRVYISGDGVNWSQLATNNSILSAPAAGSSGLFAELPDHLSTSGGFYRNDSNGGQQRVQELFDNTDAWRQARVDLGDFAGLPNLRLRFDFSTAGSLNIGGTTVGALLQALPGSVLRDGQIFSIDSVDFEFDSGFTLVAPAGAGDAIQDGETFTISDGVNPPLTFEFNKAGGVSVPLNQVISITDIDSAATVAQKVAAAIAASFAPFAVGLGGVTPHVNGHRVNLEGAVSVSQAAVIGSPQMTLEGAPGTTTGLPVVIHENMTDVQVALQMGNALDAQFTVPGNVDLPGYHTSALIDGARLQLPTHTVTFAGPLTTSSILQGDQFGNFFSNGRGQNNNFEGVFIDDIIIGFAERGEMITGAAPIPPTSRPQSTSRPPATSRSPATTSWKSAAARNTARSSPPSRAVSSCSRPSTPTTGCRRNSRSPFPLATRSAKGRRSRSATA